MLSYGDWRVFTDADNGESLMTENSIVLHDVARPIWSAVSKCLGRLEGSRFELVDRFEAFVTCEDSTHFCDPEHKNEEIRRRGKGVYIGKREGGKRNTGGKAALASKVL